MNPIINDFSIEVATVNGSGSQTANTVLLRAIFQMGIPVSGKNLFPSNIAGLPTWFTIRASAKGYIARRKYTDIMVVMNPETAAADVAKMGPGSMIVINDAIAVPEIPADRHVYSVPMKQMIEAITTNVKLRRLVVNMLYVGVLGELLGIEQAEVESALVAQLGSKPKALELNLQAVRAGREWASSNLTKTDPFQLQRMNETQDKILIDGNTAAALGAMFGGVTVVSWYPITPSSSLIEALLGYMERYRKGPDGKATYAVIQAEDELSALGMVLGAGWAGARAMTATSGPGISLMAEFTGYGYYAEIPAVVWDIQRVGPSTGLPTRTAQGDVAMVYTLSHGDTRHPILFPSSVKECFEDGMSAFDLAERLQTPVFVLSDLDIGMNNWMSEPFEYPEKPWDRGKVLDAAALEKVENWGRYKEEDGDGIPYRTLPGIDHPKGAYFTRGSGHDEMARYTENPEAFTKVLDRLAKKWETARTLVPPPLIEDDRTAKVGVIAYGSTHWAIVESRDQMRGQRLPTSYLRIRALPMTKDVETFVKRHERVYVVEQNRDGQMAEILKAELPGLGERIRSVTTYDGLPINARTVSDTILELEGLPPTPGMTTPAERSNEKKAVEGATR